MLHKAWNSKGEMPYCFPRSSIKFQGHTVQNKVSGVNPAWICCCEALNFIGYYPKFLLLFHYPEMASKEIENTFNWTTIHCTWLIPLLNVYSSTFYLFGGHLVHPLLRAIAFLAATKQLYKWYFPFVRHTFLTMFPSSYHHEIFRSYYQWPT